MSASDPHRAQYRRRNDRYPCGPSTTSSGRSAVSSASRQPDLLEEIKVGNVNRTYKVTCRQDGGRAKSYIVQRINTYAFRQPVLVMENIDKVTEHIRAKCPDRVALHFHHTADRKNYVSDEDGFWRLFNYVPSATYNTTENLSVIRSAGEAFGDFQTQLGILTSNSSTTPSRTSTTPGSGTPS